MRLPDELIESVLWSAGAEAPGDSLRRAPRVSMRCIAMLTPLERGARQHTLAREACVRDISADGASLLLASPLKSREFILELPTRSGPWAVECLRKHCDRAPEGGFVVGAQFLRFLPRGAA